MICGVCARLIYCQLACYAIVSGLKMLYLCSVRDDQQKSPSGSFLTDNRRAKLLKQFKVIKTFPIMKTSTITPATENANEIKNLSASIIAELETRKDRSAWDKSVTAYAVELVESLDNWDKQPESVAELREMLLNGADDWKAYSWGGSSLIYNQDIAERLCSPSELKRVTNKNGLRDYPNSREHWLDVQARALYQAANRVVSIARKYFNA